jgi:hypothetical protein
MKISPPLLHIATFIFSIINSAFSLLIPVLFFILVFSADDPSSKVSPYSDLLFDLLVTLAIAYYLTFITSLVKCYIAINNDHPQKAFIFILLPLIPMSLLLINELFLLKII